MIILFNDPPTTEIYTLSLHDALPSCAARAGGAGGGGGGAGPGGGARAPERRAAPSGAGLSEPLRQRAQGDGDRKSTSLNSSHANISYADFCLKKKTTYHV